MAADPMDLTTVAKAKEYIASAGSASVTTDDALVQRLVTAASVFIQTLLNRTFKSDSYVETRNGNGGNVLMFANYPVSAVAAVIVNGVSISALPMKTVAGLSIPDLTQTGYYFDDTKLMLNGYAFTRGIGNVVISYTAGYAAIPFDVEQVCIDLVARKYKDRKRIGLISESVGQSTTTYSKTDLTAEFKSLLRQYNKVVPV